MSNRYLIPMIRISDENFVLLSVDAPSILAAAEMARERYEESFAIGAAYSPAEMFEAVGTAISAADLPEAEEAAGTPPAKNS